MAVTLLQITATGVPSSPISNEKRLAIHCAMLWVAIGAMKQVDDSLAEWPSTSAGTGTSGPTSSCCGFTQTDPGRRRHDGS